MKVNCIMRRLIIFLIPADVLCASLGYVSCSDLSPSVCVCGCVCQCLLVLERLSVWLSGGEELCVWDKDFQLLCHRQKHSDTGESKRKTMKKTWLRKRCARKPVACDVAG